MTADVIGPTFGKELAAAGLAGLPISWTPDGTINGRENLTPEQNAGVDAVLAKHDPTAKDYLAPTLDMGRTAAEIMGE